jgi:hypothetical protein
MARAQRCIRQSKIPILSSVVVKKFYSIITSPNGLPAFLSRRESLKVDGTVCEEQTHGIEGDDDLE